MTQSIYRWGFTVTMVLGLALGGCSSSVQVSTRSPSPPADSPSWEEPVMTGPMNNRCPVTGRWVDENSPTVNYKERTIALCSIECLPAWHRMSIASRDTFVSARERRLSRASQGR